MRPLALLAGDTRLVILLLDDRQVSSRALADGADTLIDCVVRPMGCNRKGFRAPL
jgi:hypothetical protein